MRQGVSELSAFYASPLGQAARDMTTRKVLQSWGDCQGLEVLGAGYAAPFLGALSDRALRAVAIMPPFVRAACQGSMLVFCCARRARSVATAGQRWPEPFAVSCVASRALARVGFCR